MSMLIEGPKQPGNDISLYLGLLKEELDTLWKTPANTWDLPYWKILRVPHSLDVMHITKNVCESLLGTLLNMPERTKDGRKQGQS